MNFNQELEHFNKTLSEEGSKLRIERRGRKLSIRGSLPCQRSPKSLRNQRISLGIEANEHGLSKAKELLQLISLQLEHNQFSWENWGRGLSTENPFSRSHNFYKEITDFKKIFFANYNLSSSKSSIETNWESAYLPYLRRLEREVGIDKDLFNSDSFLRTLLSYSENSRSRLQCGTALRAFAKHLKIKLPDNWKNISYGYGLKKAKFRELPSDELILDSFNKINNSKWKLVFGLMATFGLRNHEVFFCDLSSLKKGKDHIIRVLPNTKTGEHQAWPFHPEWIEKFDLYKLAEEDSLPRINTNLNVSTLQKVGRRVSEQFRRYKLPMTPYDLRHAWAIRTIHIGLPDSVSARMMGHSVAIHTKTYHHWITRRDQQEAVNRALTKNNFKAI